jgi:hypothetical protein
MSAVAKLFSLIWRNMITHIKKRVPDFALIASSFALFMLSRYFADGYATQSGAAMHGVLVPPGPQHYHDLQHYAYSGILVFSVVSIFLKRWVAALVCLGFYAWALFSDVTY